MTAATPTSTTISNIGVAMFTVADQDAALAFYTGQLGFEELYVDEKDRWARLARAGVELAVAEADGPAETEAVVTLEVPDVKAEAERLRRAGVPVGVVLEIPGAIRLLDVFDPDGNRVQLTQDV